MISVAYQKFKSVIWGQKPWGTSNDGALFPVLTLMSWDPPPQNGGGVGVSSPAPPPPPHHLTSPHLVEGPAQEDRDAEV